MSSGICQDLPPRVNDERVAIRGTFFVVSPNLFQPYIRDTAKEKDDTCVGGGFQKAGVKEMRYSEYTIRMYVCIARFALSWNMSLLVSPAASNKSSLPSYEAGRVHTRLYDKCEVRCTCRV